MKKEKIVFYVLALILFICVICCCNRGVTHLKELFAKNQENVKKIDIGLGYTPPDNLPKNEEKK